MEISIWVISALGLAATSPEALRVYRKYGLVLAIAVWPALTAIVSLWAFLTIEFYWDSQPTTNHVFIIVCHLLLIVIAPAIAALFVTRRYNFSCGVLAGGSLLTVTSLLFFALALPVGGL
ncbi:UNVERIFIED_ORG: hypothetical protein J2W19_002036 [Shinella zoogloeoides]|nr:hypothetical protein [Shinella zoogloeoides]